MAAASVATIIMAASAAAGTGYAVYAGEKGRKMQKEAVRRQEAAQKQAEQRALATERRNLTESQRARSKKADIASLLAGAQESGGNATMLSGPRGTSSMLGE